MCELLKTHFGYDAFRPLQEEIINAVLRKKDVLVLMPTGGGKSLCFQLPALTFPGITLVVSPLIALMKDQVDALTANGIAAACLNSTLDADVQADVESRARSGALKLLYVAPERLVQPEFQAFLEQLTVSLIAIDEAHCISEWGHDFRPDYRCMKELRETFPSVPVIALTATATPRVREDILKELRMEGAPVFLSSFNRPNLRYVVRPKRDAVGQLVRLLASYKDKAVIVYCFSRKNTEEVAEKLCRAGFEALPYHAGLDRNVRRETQEKFIRDEVPVIVATIAFGMGIDKPDVRLVVHMDLPKTIESYYQETGRAGRDGLPSECVLFYAYGDRRKQEYFINMMDDGPEKALAHQKLAQVISYGETRACRRRFLLEYFGERSASATCDACDVCVPPAKEAIDASVSRPASAENLLFEQDLFQILRRERKVLADAHNVPPFVIFGDRTLQEMAYYLPQDPERLGQVFGVGSRKLARYGKIFLERIQAHARSRGLIERAHPRSKSPPSLREGSTYQKTRELIEQKRSIADIAKERGIAPGTVIGHLMALVREQPGLDIGYLKPDAERFEKIRQAYRTANTRMHTPVKVVLGDGYSYDEIKLAGLFL
ncbi:hypothetical protein A2856_04045 [Candidatus Uhrbacteria bacterium RIFCSPHIGHO2_01_FULL_63_20]|uniref:ATP-dependent DNA helicase RecQ n=1 Tax=Candidatus Uhrbacteria bacterium RIFCSPHIGHO2_01_FULL_63_20 TaxID=1802385 RepID=A0A1F7TMH8_9BACT|nr:MAG: hypothetical protein A2856_04045 [Candidatus Uhrbacteria bacterium RIFCSPHIGHO2_01_FULL_63_20]